MDISIHYMHNTPITPTNIEAPFRLHELFFSTTDTRGVIRSGNDVFVRVSEFAREELLGKPHNLIRHPDMPRCVFKLLWDTIEAHRPIVAYVKNMAKSGAFYWVMALVSPVNDGYLSIRFKPSSDLFPKVNALYRELREHELALERQGKPRRTVIESSAVLMAERLAALGYPTYEDFMHAALLTELSARERSLAGTRVSPSVPLLHSIPASRGYERFLEDCSELSHLLRGLFAQFGGFSEISDTLTHTGTYASSLAFSMQLLSTNAAIDSSKLGRQGATMSVVATRIGKSTQQIIEGVNRVNATARELMRSVNAIGFDIGVASLQVELATFYVRELIENFTVSAKERSEVWIKDTPPILRTVTQSLPITVRGAFQAVNAFDKQLYALTTTSRALLQAAQSLEFIYMNGRIEVARLNLEKTFSHMLDAIRAQLVQTRQRFNNLSTSTELLRRGFRNRDALEFRSSELLESIDHQLSTW